MEKSARIDTKKYVCIISTSNIVNLENTADMIIENLNQKKVSKKKRD